MSLGRSSPSVSRFCLLWLGSTLKWSLPCGTIPHFIRLKDSRGRESLSQSSSLIQLAQVNDLLWNQSLELGAFSGLLGKWKESYPRHTALELGRVDPSRNSGHCYQKKAEGILGSYLGYSSLCFN